MIPSFYPAHAAQDGTRRDFVKEVGTVVGAAGDQIVTIQCLKWCDSI